MLLSGFKKLKVFLRNLLVGQSVLNPNAASRCNNSDAGHKKPVNLIAESGNNFKSELRTNNMSKAKTHCIKRHVSAFLSAWCST